MSTSLLEVIEAGGYDISTREDALWLTCQVSEFEALVEQAQEQVDQEEDDE